MSAFLTVAFSHSAQWQSKAATARTAKHNKHNKHNKQKKHKKHKKHKKQKQTKKKEEEEDEEGRRRRITTTTTNNINTDNNGPIWEGSVLTGEEPLPRCCGELNHALSQAGGPAQSQQSRPASFGHYISREHRLRKRHQKVNSDTDASNEIYLKEMPEKRKRRIFPK